MTIPRTGREYHFSDYPATIEAAKTLGGAIAVMPIEKHLIERQLVIAPFERWGPVEEKVYAVYRPADRDNPAIAIFIDWMKTLFDKIDSD
jgi:DNA-binding transcriptional LysR family regulator